MRKGVFDSAMLLAATVTLVGWPANAQSAPAPANTAQEAAGHAWIERSNQFAGLLLDIQKKYAPESASRQGLAQFDTAVSQPTREVDEAAAAETRSALQKLRAAQAIEKDRNVKQDLDILIRRADLSLRLRQFNREHEVPYWNASAIVFSGLRPLLDDQVAAARRPAAVVRVTKYAGLDKGYKPLTEILEARTEQQMAKTGMIFPARTEIETEISRNADYLSGIATLFKQYGLTGWEAPWDALRKQLLAYDEWVKTTLLPKARTDFRQTPEEYALSLESYGIDIPPAQLTARAHAAFLDYQKQMQVIADKIAVKNGWSTGDYRTVIRRLKENQIVGDAILPFYKERLKEIEGIIATEHLVTLPSRPCRIRIGTPAESAQQPAPHMVAPPLLHNTGQQGEFVLPLNMPAAAGSGKSEKVDDYTFDAASWTMIAHEARPGHELQFDSMVEHGVSLARALYAFNSTNVEGWGLYAEYITLPYMPPEGQLISLQYRLLRAARAFLDPELQAGTIQPADAMRVLTQDVVLSTPFANEEVERYTFRSPGQANSYFYGFTRLLELRKDTEAALGSKFDTQKFHDFILSQGLLPPNLMRQVVIDDFVPAQKTIAAATSAGH
jgi:uncharacterized protein (DUF885 family)